MKKQKFSCIGSPIQGCQQAWGWGGCHAAPCHPSSSRGKRSLSPACAALGGNEAICPQFYGYFLPAEAVRLRELGSTMGLKKSSGVSGPVLAKERFYLVLYLKIARPY